MVTENRVNEEKRFCGLKVYDILAKKEISFVKQSDSYVVQKAGQEPGQEPSFVEKIDLPVAWSRGSDIILFDTHILIHCPYKGLSFFAIENGQISHKFIGPIIISSDVETYAANNSNGKVAIIDKYNSDFRIVDMETGDFHHIVTKDLADFKDCRVPRCAFSDNKLVVSYFSRSSSEH